ncbi:Phosphoglycolate phosphatase, HAD superfamily [Paenibacillus uliginis N3/975]|uniref:Phosphoglycolate phosphatase, HAD superfamily n=1 Tax=Paenibacillus uliginis N3/975 TaxID=1313296 RepID=A0A1X7GYN7_9BACL|nr:HAD family hydrolase [Paenibacillus uliginis]SMF76499.1 Phosphoglycolate phosphatase, HAD superfamily [Paenibacillus uliginis N3/975]
MERNESLTKPKAMIFDMDGTLFQTETLLLPAYHKLFDILREEGLHKGETPKEELMLGCLGMLLEDIWKIVLPDGSPEAHRRADELLLQLELEGLKEPDAVLYPGVEETLQELKRRGVRLFVASNGLEHYVKGIADARNIMPLFEELYSAGQHGTASKVDLVALLLKNHGIERAWMVGDRSSDVEAGKKNGQTVIGCQYAGFGNDQELKGSDAIITSFPELLNLYENAVE